MSAAAAVEHATSADNKLLPPNPNKAKNFFTLVIIQHFLSLSPVRCQPSVFFICKNEIAAFKMSFFPKPFKANFKAIYFDFFVFLFENFHHVGWKCFSYSDSDSCLFLQIYIKKKKKISCRLKLNIRILITARIFLFQSISQKVRNWSFAATRKEVSHNLPPWGALHLSQ